MKLERISSKAFYSRDVVMLARDLLGKYLIKEERNALLAGRIVEVEAYGAGDEASHSFKGLTQRNSVMFLPGGHLYVYFIYGVHYCCNVVSGKKGDGAAVLIRALEPVAGIDKLSLRRFETKHPGRRQFVNLLNGPAKICRAFKIDAAYNGLDLIKGNIYIASDKSNIPANSGINPGGGGISEQIASSKRIGITKSAGLLWRFYFKDNIFVSRNDNRK